MSDVVLLVIVLLVLGFVLLAIELFLIPGFGVIGVLGVVSLVAGSALAYFRLGAVWGFGTFLASLALAVLLVVVVLKTGLGKRFVLTETTAGTGPGAPAPLPAGGTLVGATGVAVTPLRPVGTVEVQGARYDALAEGEYIEAGREIRVVRVSGFQVIVAAAGEGGSLPSRS